MIEIQRTTTETLETPEAIAAYLDAEWRRRAAAAPFRQGDKVRATSREGLPADMMVGDVGVVLVCDPVAGPMVTVMCAHRSGLIVQAVVHGANLAKLGG